MAEAERQDVAQEVWLDVHRGLESYDPRRGSVPAWIAGIARHAVMDWHRTRRRRPEIGTFTEDEPVELRTAESGALWGFFVRAVASEEQREAFVLHEVMG